MLTSSNQYLRPEYLTPLPTTLDAKKSPLALLAQTCSAIGADSPNPKLISAAEKASLKSSHKYVSDGSREKTSPAAGHESKASFKPYESCLTARDKARSPEERASSGSRAKTPSSKGSAANTPVQARCGSNQSSSSQRTSPTDQRKSPSEKSTERTSPSRDSPAGKHNGDSSNSSGSLPSPTTSKSSFAPSALGSAGDSSVKDLPLGTFKPGLSIPVSSSSFLGLHPSGFPLPMDLMAGGLMAAQHHALKNGLNPYLAYSRMKTPGGSDAPVCRDPYCAGCSLSSHLASGMKASACPAGCAQCDHARHPAAAAYAHAQLAALAAASQLPYVCNWMAGDAAYCGKRFAGSEELLQHLRSHTSGSGEVGPALSLLAAHPLLQRSYPTPPLSPLAPRFHPYSKPSQFLPSPPLHFAMPPHPSLAAYFAPYPLFGPRALHP